MTDTPTPAEHDAAQNELGRLRKETAFQASLIRRIADFIDGGTDTYTAKSLREIADDLDAVARGEVRP